MTNWCCTYIDSVENLSHWLRWCPSLWGQQDPDYSCETQWVCSWVGPTWSYLHNHYTGDPQCSLPCHQSRSWWRWCQREWCLFNYTIRSKKNTTFSKSIFSFHIYQNTTYYIYQIQHNWMNFMMLKTVSKNILQRTFYISLKSTFKNTSHKKRHIQGKRRLLITF